MQHVHCSAWIRDDVPAACPVSKLRGWRMFIRTLNFRDIFRLLVILYRTPNSQSLPFLLLNSTLITFPFFVSRSKHPISILENIFPSQFLSSHRLITCSCLVPFDVKYSLRVYRSGVLFICGHFQVAFSVYYSDCSVWRRKWGPRELWTCGHNFVVV